MELKKADCAFGFTIVLNPARGGYAESQVDYYDRDQERDDTKRVIGVHQRDSIDKNRGAKLYNDRN